MRATANEPNTGVLRVAILGSGPSGSALAAILAGRGAEVTLFELGRRPELLVGESLVPAVIPMLRRLGVEEQVAAIGLEKPGASFVWSPTDRFSFTFARFAPAVPPYAYNVPRPRFDEVLLANALEPPLTALVGDARRVTSVATYSNYQLISRRGYGPGWVLVGDALGFVDPMLSPGVSLAPLSAELLAEGLTPLIHGRSSVELASAMARYTAAQMANLYAWFNLVRRFPDAAGGQVHAGDAETLRRQVLRMAPGARTACDSGRSQTRMQTTPLASVSHQHDFTDRRWQMLTTTVQPITQRSESPHPRSSTRAPRWGLIRASSSSKKRDASVSFRCDGGH